MKKRFFKIDEVDIKILQTIQRDGRISNIELSEKVGISPSPCLRRLKSLKDQGVIKSYHAEIDESFFGYNTTIFASITIDNSDDLYKEEFEKKLSEISSIREIYALAVETDYLIKMVVKDWYDYKHIVNSKIIKVPHIKKIRTTTILRTIKKDNYFEISDPDLQPDKT